MRLGKRDIEAIDQLVRLSIFNQFGKMERALAQVDSRLNVIEKKFEDGISDFTSNLESIRDVLSG